MLSTRNKIRIAAALSAAVRSARRLGGHSDDIVCVRRDGLRWRLDLNEGIDFTIFLLGTFERTTMRAYRRLLKPGDVVLDIGANIGAHTLQFARLVGEHGRVFAFEPTAFAFAKLLQNLELNPELCGRVAAKQIMLADRDDAASEAAIYSSWPLKKVSGLHQGHGGLPKTTAGCRVITLDSFLASTGSSRVDLVKLDVDGFEWDVLHGGIKSLAVLKPKILMELSPYVLIEHHHSLGDLLSVLSSGGFRLHRMNGKLLAMDPGYLNALVPAGKSLNVLAMAH